jgi:hypothetical protein
MFPHFNILVKFPSNLLFDRSSTAQLPVSSGRSPVKPLDERLRKLSVVDVIILNGPERKNFTIRLIAIEAKNSHVYKTDYLPERLLALKSRSVKTKESPLSKPFGIKPENLLLLSLRI